MNRCKCGLLLTALFYASLLLAADEERVPPPRHYLFSLGGLSDKQVVAMKSVPGVQEVAVTDGRTRVVFQPFNDNPWCKAAEGKPKWIKGAENFYDFIPVKRQIGRTRWTHGGLGDINSDTIIWYGPILSGSRSYPLVFNMMFNDLETKQNEVMSFRYYSDCDPNQLEHEMLRGLVGEPIRIENCGKGHALVAGKDRRACVAWQVSELAFVRIDFCFDREMVAAYIDRLGCITPSDYKVSVDAWVENEIRWRMKQLDCAYEQNMLRGFKRLSFVEFLVQYLPPAAQKYGDMRGEASWHEIWQFLWNCRHFLWANRANFKYQPNAGWFVLKDKDLYDPEHPPELPEELRGPPKPAEEQIRASEAMFIERARKDLDEALRGQIKVWNNAYESWVKTGRFNGRDWGYFGFNFGFIQLEEKLGSRGAKLTLKEAGPWLDEARGWLWANRDNFAQRDGGYYLKGKDLYDSANPPELPEDLRGPRKVVPSPERTKQGTPKGP